MFTSTFELSTKKSGMFRKIEKMYKCHEISIPVSILSKFSTKYKILAEQSTISTTRV